MVAVTTAGAAADAVLVVAAAANQHNYNEDDPQAGVVVIHAHHIVTSLKDVVFYAVKRVKEPDRGKIIQENQFTGNQTVLVKNGEYGGFNGKLQK